MSMSSNVPQSSFVSDPNVPPASSPALSQPATTQIIPGTTVIGTGTTGDVWSYTIPPITSVVVASEAATSTSPPSSIPAPNSSPDPSGTYVATQFILSGTTVVGGTETGVPWSYTIPDQSIASSVFVPFTVPPTAIPSESFPATSSLTSPTESPPLTHPPLPGYTEPVPRPPPDTSHTTLSGGIVAAILIGLFLLMFAIAGYLCFRLRKRQREGGADLERAKEKEVGVVWGRAWGSEDKGVGAWRKRQKMNRHEGGGDGYIRGEGSEVVAPPGTTLGPTVRFQHGSTINPASANESTELLIDRQSRERGPTSLYSPNTRPHTAPPTNSNITYPVAAQYPQARSPDTIPNIDTRTSLSHPTQRNVNAPSNDDMTNREPPSTKSPTAKLKRPIPAPSPHVYAPPPEETPEPSLKAAYSTNPFSTRPTSPYRAASPYSQTSSSQGRKVLSKQRAASPTTSAFMRHMLPSRTLSLRRPKPAPSVPPPSSTDAPPPARPGLTTLPSFIRDRRFSPGPSRNGSKSTSQGEGESVIFSPSPRPGKLPSNVPIRINSPASRSAPALVQSRLPSARDKFLAPPSYGYGGRDRSSQLTSTTRSGGTGWSRDTRSTGRSGGSVMTGRSGDSRQTGRSGRAGALAQIPENDREPGSGRRRHDRSPGRHGGP